MNFPDLRLIHNICGVSFALFFLCIVLMCDNGYSHGNTILGLVYGMLATSYWAIFVISLANSEIGL